MGRWAAYRLLHRLTSFSAPSPSYSIRPLSLFLLSSDPTTQFRRFRPFSSAPSSSYAALAHDLDYGFRDSSHNYVDEVQSCTDVDEQQQEEAAKIPVKAFFLSTRFTLFTFF